jgi:hypothetical protein
VYDMYPWDSRADGPRAKKPAPAARREDTAAADPDPATVAVQVALDRRDNGGEGTRQLTAVAATASQVRK